ncbi:hypothetical protein VNO77_34508 [Canavalia gladiata]|uniref:Uncharacterized protein n=1 Tax=Canavalia gladiata TaxID=3824 RepID=A0AAN9KGA5_CANGL
MEQLGRRKRLWNQEDALCSGEEILTKERREFRNLLKVLQEGKERSRYIENSEEVKKCPCMKGDAQDGVRATIKTMQLYKALTRDLEFKVVQELKLEAELGPFDGAT